MSASAGTANQVKCDIAFLISDLDVGGAQRVLVNLANQLTSDGCQIALITMDTSDSDYFQFDERIQRIELGVKEPSTSFVSAMRANMRRIVLLRNVIRDSGAACIVSFVGRMNILTIIATRFLGKKVIISERNDPARESLGVLWDVMRRFVYGRADVVTANSRGAIKSLSRYVQENKLCYVPNVMTKVATQYRSVNREKWILAVGRLEPQKGYDVLLEAFAQLSSRVDEWKLVIIGEGSQKLYLKELAEKLGIPSERMVWKGKRDPYPFYFLSSIFVLPSRYEGTPNALIEALQCGLPAIVSDTSSGALEYVENGKTGLVIPVDDPVKLLAALDQLVKNQKLRQRLGEAGKRYVNKEGDGSAIAMWKDLLQLDAHSMV